MLKDNSSQKEGGQGQSEEIQNLQAMIANAERTIMSAKQAISKLGSSAPGAPSVSNNGDQIVHGAFDGQIMIGEDGKQYPVPANYASKSKLVEGDTLKLTISPQGTFMYKQIGPIDRKFLIGVAKQDERGNFIIHTEEKDYKVLLAAATYFKIEADDEVTIVIPRDAEAVWGAIENVIRKASDPIAPRVTYQKPAEDLFSQEEKIEIEEPEESPRSSAVERLQKEIEEERRSQANQEDLLDEWSPDAEELKKEAKQPAKAE